MTALATFGCVDPQKTFDEYQDRVIDAAPVEGCPVVDFFPLNGEFLLGIQTALGPPLRFIVTVSTQQTESGGIADLSFMPLIADNCDKGMGGQETGEELPPLNDVVVGSDGAFQIIQNAVVTAARANPLTCSPILADIEFTGCTQSDSFICGAVDGMVMEPIEAMLDGSTFGAVQIETGTRGDDNLPDPVAACPAES